MFYVILHRDPYKENLKYGPEFEPVARNRVDALMQLHGCISTLSGDTFHVWASAFYKPREAKEAPNDRPIDPNPIGS